jgi:threonine synthase
MPYAEGDPFGPPRSSQTLADSIAVDVPRNGLHALSKLKKHGGKAVVVSDDEILVAQKHLPAAPGCLPNRRPAQRLPAGSKFRQACRVRKVACC